MDPAQHRNVGQAESGLTRFSNSSTGDKPSKETEKTLQTLQKLLDAIGSSGENAELATQYASQEASRRSSAPAAHHAAAPAAAVPRAQSDGPGMTKFNSSSSAVSAQRQIQLVSFRIWDCGAINAPGLLYKAVAVTPDMTSRELITECISKFGASVDPATLELHFAVDYDDSVPKKKRVEPAKVLEADECPYLVAEWFTDLPRRFEIHKTSGDVKQHKKFYKYWNSPINKSGRRWSSMLPGRK